MANKVGREMRSTPDDALNLVGSLKGTPGCYAKWEVDGSGRLNKIFWSTADQQLLAHQYSHLVIQDNTCLTNKYDLKLMLFIGVYSENESVVLAQGFFSDEQTTSFATSSPFVVRTLRRGAHERPETVIITDADAAMTRAVAERLANTVHLHCLWHIMKNVKKKCQGALGHKTSHLQSLLYAC
ncbi:unnamed protein product, partial [Laminaria digitata]